MDEDHYGGNCSIIKFAMQLSGRMFDEFEIDHLPAGYVEDDDFGPRVYKYDWFELLGKFPTWIGFLGIAGLAALIGILWLYSPVKGLRISGRNKHRFCRFLVTFLLILLLLPLVTGLYLSSRANHLLRMRTHNNDHKMDRESADSLDQNELVGYKAAEEFQNYTLHDEYENVLGELVIELDKAIANELIAWQQIMFQNEQTNFKLEHLFENRVFYKDALEVLPEISYELVILGIEIDDFLRDFTRLGLQLQSRTTFEAKNESSLFLSREHLNVWHLSALYFHYIYTEECFEYLMEAYANITKIHEAIAKLKTNFVEIEHLQLKAPILKQLTHKFGSNADLQEKHAIQKSILLIALAMVFATAALIYILFMVVGFSIFRYYEEANCLIRCFTFVGLLSIVVLALLSVLHFLLTMVLHTGVCHKNNSNSFLRAASHSPIIEPLGCSPYPSNNNIKLPTKEIQKNLLAIISRQIPHERLSHLNITDEYTHLADHPLPEKWYEADMQALLATDDVMPYIAYLKQYYLMDAPDADIFLCKFDRLEHSVRQELYAEEFVPNATLLYKTVRNVRDRVRIIASSSNLKKLLEDALDEIYIFEQFYAMTRKDFLDALDEKLDVILQKFNRKYFTKSSICSRDSQNEVSSTRSKNSHTKCGCLEDWLMIYAIGGALLVLSLFVSMIFSMLLYKLNKHGPALFIPKRDDGTHSIASGVPSAQEADSAGYEMQTTSAPSKHYVVNVKSDFGKRSANYGGPQTRPTATVINTSDFNTPMMSGFGYQVHDPETKNHSQFNSQQMSDTVVLQSGTRSRPHVDGAGTSTEAQLVTGSTIRAKRSTEMLFQRPEEMQQVVDYRPPAKLKRQND